MHGDSRVTKRAAVTGGAGFLGKAITARLLAESVGVVTIDATGEHPTAATAHVAGSVLDQATVARGLAGAQYVFHLAGILGTTETIDHPDETFRVNVGGTIAVLEGALAAGARSLFYPSQPGIWPNPYSLTKRASQELLQFAARHLPIDITILRWLNVYGPGQKLLPVRKAVPLFIVRALFDRPLVVFGTGEAPVDLEYVDDVARITVAFAMSGQSGMPVPRDSGAASRLTVNGLAQRIRELCGSRSPILHAPMRAGEDEREQIKPLPEPTAAQLLGIAGCTVDLDEGLSRTIAHYRSLPAATLHAALDYFEGVDGELSLRQTA